jgi:uncharacterized protein (DUF1330 family)
MTAYAIIHVTVRDPAGMGKYVERMPALQKKYGARVLANDRAGTTIEGAARPGSRVIIEFPDVARAKAFYADPDYLAAKQLRAGAAELEVVIVEGLAGH